MRSAEQALIVMLQGANVAGGRIWPVVLPLENRDPQTGDERPAVIYTSRGIASPDSSPLGARSVLRQTFELTCVAGTHAAAVELERQTADAIELQAGVFGGVNVLAASIIRFGEDMWDAEKRLFGRVLEAQIMFDNS